MLLQNLRTRQNRRRSIQRNCKATILLLTTATNSKEVHTTCLTHMNLLKQPLVLIFIFIIASRHCPIGSVFHSHHVKIESTDLRPLRVVMVFRAGAHVVCIWVYLNMSRWGRSLTDAWGMGTYSILELGSRQNGCTEHTRDKGHMKGLGCRQVCKCHTRHGRITKKQREKDSPALLLKN